MKNERQEGGNKKLWGCLLGCLGVLLISGILVAVGIYYAAVNAKRLVVYAARTMVVKTLEQSDLSPEDKQQVIAQVDRIAEEVNLGRLNTESVQRVMQSLSQSPAMSILVIYAIEAQYVSPSGLSEDEKKDARLTLQRIRRGVMEEKLHAGQFEHALSHVSTKADSGQIKPKQQVTDEELRAFLAESKAIVDAANISNEPYQVSIGEEVKRAVDKALEAAQK